VLRTLYAWTIGVVYTVLWSALGIVTWPLSPRGDLYLSYARIWSAWILGSLRIPLVVEGRDRLDPGATYLFLSNHRSTFDVFTLFLVVEHPFRMIAKRALFYVPVLGWSLWMCGFIPIDRADRESAIRSLKKAAGRLRQGQSILVFPEGTRARDAGIQPFKKGGFHLALEAGVPIVPIVLLGTERIMPPGSRRVGQGTITARIGRPIPTAGRTVEHREELMRETHAVMEALAARSVAREPAPA
jgi:1-acyl-sn-glycerol-3-phosphate acyltransferase